MESYDIWKRLHENRFRSCVLFLRNTLMKEFGRRIQRWPLSYAAKSGEPVDWWEYTATLKTCITYEAYKKNPTDEHLTKMIAVIDKNNGIRYMELNPTA